METLGIQPAVMNEPKSVGGGREEICRRRQGGEEQGKEKKEPDCS